MVKSGVFLRSVTLIGLLIVVTFAGHGRTVDMAVSSSGLVRGESGQIAYVIDGDTFVLRSGLRVQLAGIQVPKPARAETGLKAWPLADTAKAELRNLLQNRTVQLYYGGDRRDRYDRAMAQVRILDEQNVETGWVQEVMVRAGLARVYTWPQTRINHARLYAAEQEARYQGRGIWNTKAGFYDVRKPDPDPLAQYVDTTQLVEGVIVSTAKVRDTIYLNFGSNYRTDFTVAIGKRDRKAFKTAEYDPLLLAGARVRVRGWIELQNGPIIWLNDPRRLEILE